MSTLESNPRRAFLARFCGAVAGVIGAALAWPVVKYVTFPVRRRVIAGVDEAVPVADAATIGNGRPVRVAIIAKEQRDAWAKATHVRLGAAWLVRDGAGELRAFSTTCPHLGCAIDFDEAAGEFRCPCHQSSFATDGTRIEGPAKRGMDPLEVTVADGTVRVSFQRFVLDTPHREKA